jgi:hypothetical protein
MNLAHWHDISDRICVEELEVARRYRLAVSFRTELRTRSAAVLPPKKNFSNEEIPQEFPRSPQDFHRVSPNFASVFPRSIRVFHRWRTQAQALSPFLGKTERQG